MQVMTFPRHNVSFDLDSGHFLNPISPETALALWHEMSFQKYYGDPDDEQAMQSRVSLVATLRDIILGEICYDDDYTGDNADYDDDE